MANRLINSTSPYLLQHAHNPVDWYPWGPEALDRARREDKPIFLSIGYAACHWCHVMEHQVFENPEIAALMNEHCINIKVDREERPDLDELYMLATQLMTGQGGWPMSVWLTPDLKPFYAGTYFPPTDGYGRPGFPKLTLALAEAWKKRRQDLEEQARRVVEAIQTHADETAGDGKTETPKSEVIAAWLRLATEQFNDRFDTVNGGLGGAPKFPPHQALALWVAQINAAPDASILNGQEQGQLAAKLMLTLDAMAAGGIYDHIGGASARYSTDERWLVPHFEKMLYDSAQLAPVYAAASILLEKPDYARIARETLDFFVREMRSDQGAFYSSLDADSEGAEGKFYVWTPADVQAAVGDDATLIIEHFGLTDRGNWHESPVPGASVLAVAVNAESLAERHGTTPVEMRQRLDRLLERMRAFRAQRPPPGLDDKILTSWNGLMLSGLAATGRFLNEPRYIEAAHRLAKFLWTHHLQQSPEGPHLLRVSRQRGPAHTDGFLDDHAFLLNGFLDLLDATEGPPRKPLKQQAAALADTMLAQFEDKSHGGFFYTGPRHENLFARMKNAADNATPSANGVTIRALLRLSRATGDDKYRSAAMRAVQAFATNIQRRPEYFPTTLLALLEDGTTAPQAAPPPPPDTTQPTTAPAAEQTQHLQLSVEPLGPVAPGRPFELRVHLTIASGYHVQSPEGHPTTDPTMTKTVVRVRLLDRAETLSQEWQYPPADAGQYAGTIVFVGKCILPANTPASTLQCRAIVEAQVCSQSACFAPQHLTADFLLHIAH